MRFATLCLLGLLLSAIAGQVSGSPTSLDELEVEPEGGSLSPAAPSPDPSATKQEGKPESMSRRTWFGMGYERRRRVIGLSGRTGGRGAARGRR